MARVTVEDCILKVSSRFELVMLASQRARELNMGAPLTVERDNDKNPVISLREIAEETISLEETKDRLIKRYQKVLLHDDFEEEEIELMEGEQGWNMPQAMPDAVVPGSESQPTIARDQSEKSENTVFGITVPGSEEQPVVDNDFFEKAMKSEPEESKTSEDSDSVEDAAETEETS